MELNCATSFFFCLSKNLFYVSNNSNCIAIKTLTNINNYYWIIAIVNRIIVLWINKFNFSNILDSDYVRAVCKSNRKIFNVVYRIKGAGIPYLNVAVFKGSISQRKSDVSIIKHLKNGSNRYSMRNKRININLYRNLKLFATVNAYFRNSVYLCKVRHKLVVQVFCNSFCVVAGCNCKRKNWNHVHTADNCNRRSRDSFGQLVFQLSDSVAKLFYLVVYVVAILIRYGNHTEGIVRRTVDCLKMRNCYKIIFKNTRNVLFNILCTCSRVNCIDNGLRHVEFGHKLSMRARK